jgi:cysteine desulfurase
MGWHYLDHAATSPARPEAVAALTGALAEGYGNPSGSHALARAARIALDAARAELAEVVGCRPGELVFTSGGTESDNLAVRGVLGARGGRAVCSAIEHHAVLEPVLASGGTTVAVDRRGVIDLDHLADTLDDDVTLVSVGLVNNEVGTVQPLAAVAEVVRARAPGAVLHTDAAQALSWLDVAELARPADLVTLASHKTGGPVGTGALVVRDGVRLQAVQLGGGQERERRSGTQDVAGAAAFAAGARAAADGRSTLLDRAAGWRRLLVDAVRAGVPGAIETVPGGDAVPGIVHLCLPEVDSEAVLFLLEHDHRVLASAAASCASGAQERSHVLAALGLDAATAHGALRISFGWSTTDADVAAAAAGVVVVVARLRAHARDGAPA